MWRRQKVSIFMKICIFHRKIRKFCTFFEIAGFVALVPCHEARSEGVVARPERRRRSTQRPQGAPYTKYLPRRLDGVQISKNHFFTQNALPERPGSLPKAPADTHGTALESPRVARGGPRAPKLPKIVPKWTKMHDKWNPTRFFEIHTNFHHFVHGFWKFFVVCFATFFRQCVFE